MKNTRQLKFDTLPKYACDFETTVYEGQQYTEVWSSAICPIGCDEENDVLVHHSIGETFKWACSQKTDIVLYYHNLKFDGEFWVYYLLNEAGYEPAYSVHDGNDFSLVDIKEMKEGTFKPVISDMGQWYQIAIKTPKNMVMIRDSLKLMPFTLKEIGTAFKTKHQKLEMEYTGERYAGCEITEEEMKYIKNDVLVLSEALQFMFDEGHKRLTIGACCFEEFKKTQMREAWNYQFPDLTKIAPDDKEEFRAKDADDYVRRSYHGGWCYASPRKSGRIIENGCTFDVNSLYPSVMHSDSGNKYPIGSPTFFTGSIPECVYKNDLFYFVTIQCKFHVKQGYLPFIQIKHNRYYKSTECLTSSYVGDGEIVYDEEGKPVANLVEMVMSKPDYELFLEHYDVEDLVETCGCYFSTDIGLFDTYINRYRKIKMESKGAKRTEAKLFLNNLYGKFASGTDSTYKVPFMFNGIVKYHVVPANEKKSGFIPIGSAVTSYARCFTIRAAQKNYEHFCYADTDSIHLDCPPEEAIGVPQHPTAFCHWKCESTWDKAKFVRQKTYIEHVITEDFEPVEPYYNVRCAGMPKVCKDLYVESMMETEEQAKEHYDKWWSNEGTLIDRFLLKIRTLEDFGEGLSVPCKLLPVRIKGGIVLKETTFEIR